MASTVVDVLEEALRLPAEDRSRMIDELLASLHEPSPALEAIWTKEAEVRLAAYDAGLVKAYPAEEVFAELESV